MTRLRRRRMRRRRRMLLLVAVIAALGAGAFFLRRPDFIAERLSAPTPQPLTGAWDRTAVTREVTLAEEVWYAIQTGVFSAPEAAEDKADDYAERGAPGTVVQQEGKWRVFIACYGREEDAQAVRTRLGEMQRVETYLYRWSCPQLRLRLSGMAGQLDAVEAGLTLMMGAAARLRDTATLLDAAQLTAQEAAGVISDLNGQIALWSQTARDRFGASPPPLVEQLLAIAADWPLRSRTLQDAADSAVTLSAEMKGQGMRLYADMICLRETLNAQ